MLNNGLRALLISDIDADPEISTSSESAAKECGKVGDFLMELAKFITWGGVQVSWKREMLPVLNWFFSLHSTLKISCNSTKQV